MDLNVWLFSHLHPKLTKYHQIVTYPLTAIHECDFEHMLQFGCILSVLDVNGKKIKPLDPENICLPIFEQIVTSTHKYHTYSVAVCQDLSEYV